MTKKAKHYTDLEWFLSWAYVIICGVLWLFLILGLLSIGGQYIIIILNNKSIFGEDVFKIAIYIVIGSYLFLFMHKDQTERIFKVKNYRTRKRK